MSQVQTRQAGALAQSVIQGVSEQTIGRGISSIAGGLAGDLDAVALKTGFIPVGTTAKFLDSASGAIVSFILVNGSLAINDIPFKIKSIDYSELTTKSYWQFLSAEKDGLPLVYNQTTTLFHAEVLDGSSGTIKKKFDNTGVLINA